MNATPPREDRLHALDSLRATAMFLGIVLHAVCSFVVFPIGTWPVRDVTAAPAFEVVFGVIHGFRMHLFFLLAGFFGRLLHARLGSEAFLQQRLKRIGLPFVAGMFVAVGPFVLIAIWNLTVRQPELAAIALQTPDEAIGPPTLHLWFLQFLLVYYLVAIAASRAAGRVRSQVPARLESVFERLMRSPWRIVLFVPLTMACLWNGPVWGDPEFPGAGMVPAPRALAHYGLFFFAGWWLHRRRELLDELKRFVMPSLLVALIALAVWGAIMRSRPYPSQPDYTTLKVVALACAGTYAWAMSFGLTGAFLRFAARPRAVARYLADASYWCYLAHPPLLLGLQALIAPWKFPALLKLTLLVTVTMTILLAVYQAGVRYTGIGTVLNGPRHRPLKSRPPVPVVTEVR